MMRNVLLAAASSAAVLTATPPAAATPAMDERHACRWIHRRGDHAGQTVTLRGHYLADSVGAVLIPDHCDAGIAVARLSANAEAAIRRLDPPDAAAPVMRSVEGVFTGSLVRVAPAGPFFHDDGLRLDVQDVAGVRAPS